MRNIRVLTSGESHGEALYGIIEGIPAGLKLSNKDFEKDSIRRRSGIGRSERVQIESDKVEIKSGISWNSTTGAPITIRIPNIIRYDSRLKALECEDADVKVKPLTRPRPGHADFVGSKKFGIKDIREIIERASARETAARCALGSIAKKFLGEFGLRIISRVLAIADIGFTYKCLFPTSEDIDKNWDSFITETEKVYKNKKTKLRDLRKKLTEKGDTCGGAFQVIAHKMPIGLGTYTQADGRLDAILAKAVMSIPSVKAFSMGAALEKSFKYGSSYTDEFKSSRGRISRKSNNAGGIEGGISNGEPLLIRGFVKPVPTLASPGKTIDMETGKQVETFYENADYWVVESIGVIAESTIALILMDEFLSKYGGNSMDEIHRHFNA